MPDLPTVAITQRARGDIRIGISGWNYQPWRGIFYPAGVPHTQELAFAATQFSAIRWA